MFNCPLTSFCILAQRFLLSDAPEYSLQTRYTFFKWMTKKRSSTSELLIGGWMTSLHVHRWNKLNFDKKRENYKLFWTRTILSLKKCLPINQPFPWVYVPWEKFKGLENECPMNWTIDKWSDTKTVMKTCSSDKKESCSYIGLWLEMRKKEFPES